MLKMNRSFYALNSFSICVGILLLTNLASQAQTKKPNILVIFGDDVGQTNISAYGFGVVGYKTPNLDKLAHEGMMFTDYYAENSCTAGRSTFITGQCPKRTGLSKVGIPGAPVGLLAHDITIAQALKPLGYTPPASLVKTTWVIWMNICRLPMALMNSSEICIT